MDGQHELRTDELLNRMVKLFGCTYVSDLHRGITSEQAELLWRSVSPEDYTSEEWSEVFTYIYGRPLLLEYPAAAHEFLEQISAQNNI